VERALFCTLSDLYEDPLTDTTSNTKAPVATPPQISPSSAPILPTSKKGGQAVQAGQAGQAGKTGQAGLKTSTPSGRLTLSPAKAKDSLAKAKELSKAQEFATPTRNSGKIDPAKRRVLHSCNTILTLL
jgi:hypothetical protein